MQGQTLPIARFKAGQVSAALWENEIVSDGRKAVILKDTVQRRYKDRNNEWKSSTSFARNEIPLAIYCLQQAFEKIIELQNDESNSSVVKEEMVM